MTIDSYYERWIAGTVAALAGVAYASSSAGKGHARRFYAEQFKKRVVSDVRYDDELTEASKHWASVILQTEASLAGLTVFVLRSTAFTSDVVFTPGDGAFADDVAAYADDPSKCAVIFYPTDREAVNRLFCPGYVDSLVLAQPELAAAACLLVLHPVGLTLTALRIDPSTAEEISHKYPRKPARASSR
ncbi:hypothetical protein DIPPA_26505 [Diplonema papillatum]|nr:hypothetical protein DIPPA_26505 [Diplonema papillatum]KAJ9460697.1 hypothetical protein DIPPA_26505 [Diplonema papillatum]